MACTKVSSLTCLVGKNLLSEYQSSVHGEEISVCYEDRKKHMIVLHGQNADILCITVLHVITIMF